MNFTILSAFLISLLTFIVNIKVGSKTPTLILLAIVTVFASFPFSISVYNFIVSDSSHTRKFLLGVIDFLFSEISDEILVRLHKLNLNFYCNESSLREERFEGGLYLGLGQAPFTKNMGESVEVKGVVNDLYTLLNYLDTFGRNVGTMIIRVGFEHSSAEFDKLRVLSSPLNEPLLDLGICVNMFVLYKNGSVVDTIRYDTPQGPILKDYLVGKKIISLSENLDMGLYSFNARPNEISISKKGFHNFKINLDNVSDTMKVLECCVMFRYLSSRKNEGVLDMRTDFLPRRWGSTAVHLLGYRDLIEGIILGSTQYSLLKLKNGVYICESSFYENALLDLSEKLMNKHVRSAFLKIIDHYYLENENKWEMGFNILGSLKSMRYARRLEFPGKFDALWTGPYIIKEVFPNNSVQLKNLDGLEFPTRTNGGRCKEYKV